MNMKSALCMVALLCVAMLAATSALADSYTFKVYDSGTGSYKVGTGSSQPLAGSLTNDPSNPGSQALVFQLPFTTVAGDYSLDGVQGLIRFYNVGSTSDLIFYETKSLDGSLAGTGIPTNTNIVGSITGLSLPVLGSFTPGSGAAGSSSGNTVSYTFYDTPSAPEPTGVVALSSLCGMGLIGLVWRRRK